MVFQNLGLWPHLSARDHLACVLTGGSRRERTQRLEQVLAEVELPPAVWNQRPAELSGGESHRLALARAIAPLPDVLLLDEPLAQVDTVLRRELLALVGRVAARQQMTVVYVSHAWSEVSRLCQRAAVLEKGMLIASGTVDELFFRPPTVAAARLTGPVVECPRALVASGRLALVAGGEAWPCTPLVEGESLAVRPQQIHFTEPSTTNRWTVMRCQPASIGWSITLQGDGAGWEIATGMSVPVGRVVGVAVALGDERGARPGAAHGEALPQPIRSDTT
jgi:ABC-type sulfate/molybdate transport systems ATPase subunit